MKKQLSSRYKKALLYAFKLHREQTRKASGVPYYGHLMGVSAIVLENGGTEKQTIAALLHDAVEDQGGKKTLKKIEKRFGKKVARIVKGCSDTDKKKKPPYLVRKGNYLLHLPQEPADVLLVSLADKYYNATTIYWDMQRDPGFWSRFNASKEDILWYYCRLDRIYQEKLPGVLANEFHLLVERLRTAALPEKSSEDLINLHDLSGVEKTSEIMVQNMLQEEK